MRALLIHRDRDLDLGEGLPAHADALVQDLQLDTLLDAMAGADKLVREVSRHVLLASTRGDVETIEHRQAILKDCLANPELVRNVYALCGEALEARKKLWGYSLLGRYPESILRASVQLLELLSSHLRELRKNAENNAPRFQSRGFTQLFATLRTELADEYLDEIGEHLSQLKFKGGIPVSARLGESGEGRDYVLHVRHVRRWAWLERLLGEGTPAFVVRIPERDEAGARALSELREKGLAVVAKALSQSADHVIGFFELLRTDLAFYLGAMNLSEHMVALGVSTAFPGAAPPGGRALRARGLCDVSLALGLGTKVVPNDLAADGKSLCVITGANQGGKTCFLRAMGLAQLMMHAGLFVAADSFTAEVATGIFTHFRREEDASMRSGKLDEELGRMSSIADALTPDAVVLFNESFAATNEREGSEIARQVVTALLERRVRVAFVTHLYTFAHGLFEREVRDSVFLRAERREDGARTFKLVEGEPLETSYGEDVYREVFGTDGVPGAADAGRTHSRNEQEEVPPEAAMPIR